MDGMTPINDSGTTSQTNNKEFEINYDAIREEAEKIKR